MRLFSLILVAVVYTVVAEASDLRLDGKFIQGGLVVGSTLPGAVVAVDGRSVRVSSEGRFLIGFSRDAGPSAQLRVRLPDGREMTRALSIAKRTYKVQQINGLPRKMVTPPAFVYARIRSENAEIAKARAQDTAVPRFESGWVWPALGRISGVYGSQRILNGKPRQPHYGIDIAAPMGTPVVSPADAVVVLVHRDMYYTGGTIILDHGHGLSSAMLHMNTIDVGVGDVVGKGQKIGTVGKSGRATGPHLDWRINLFKARLDPGFLVPPMSAPGKK